MELNYAMFLVMSNQYKKDCKEAHEMVEKAGFEIHKNNGHFYIRNRNTRRELFLTDRWDYEERGIVFYVHYNYNLNAVKYKGKFDFVNCLNTPIRSQEDSFDYYKTAYGKYDRLKNLKWSVEWDKKNIEKIKNQIVSLQNDLERAIRSEIRDSLNLEEYRKEVGLK